MRGARGPVALGHANGGVVWREPPAPYAEPPPPTPSAP
jgi:hypothetical protein